MHMAGKGRYIAADNLVSTVLEAAGIAALDADQWDALSLAALDDNPFYARPYVLAGLATIDRSANLRALARCGMASTVRWWGCSPIACAVFRWPARRLPAISFSFAGCR